MLDLLWHLKLDAQHLAFALLFLVSLAWGQAPERLLAGILLAMVEGDVLYHILVGGSILWRHTDLGHLLFDTLILVAIWIVAIHANRTYPLWLGGAQIIVVLAHLCRMMLERVNNHAYDVMSILPSYIQLATLALGLGVHMHRRKRLGRYPSWRSTGEVAA